MTNPDVLLLKSSMQYICLWVDYLFCLLFAIFNWQGTFNVVDFVKPSAAELSTVGSRVPFFEGVGPDQLFRDP